MEEVAVKACDETKVEEYDDDEGDFDDSSTCSSDDEDIGDEMDGIAGEEFPQWIWESNLKRWYMFTYLSGIDIPSWANESEVNFRIWLYGLPFMEGDHYKTQKMTDHIKLIILTNPQLTKHIKTNNGHSM